MALVTCRLFRQIRHSIKAKGNSNVFLLTDEFDITARYRGKKRHQHCVNKNSSLFTSTWNEFALTLITGSVICIRIYLGTYSKPKFCTIFKMG